MHHIPSLPLGLTLTYRRYCSCVWLETEEIQHSISPIVSINVQHSSPPPQNTDKNSVRISFQDLRSPIGHRLLLESLWLDGAAGQASVSGCRTASSSSLIKCLRSSRHRSRISPRFSRSGTCSCFSKLGSLATSIFTTMPKVSQSCRYTWRGQGRVKRRWRGRLSASPVGSATVTGPMPRRCTSWHVMYTLSYSTKLCSIVSWLSLLCRGNGLT